jgi:hypothetical protein
MEDKRWKGEISIGRGRCSTKQKCHVTQPSDGHPWHQMMRRAMLAKQGVQQNESAQRRIASAEYNLASSVKRLLGLAHPSPLHHPPRRYTRGKTNPPYSSYPISPS